jgi:hypothetical protein
MGVNRAGRSIRGGPLSSLPPVGDFLASPHAGTLYYGDNLDILRRYLKDESVDLVYLDSPSNFAQNYNAFFHEKDGPKAAKPEQIIIQVKDKPGVKDVLDLRGVLGRENAAIGVLISRLASVYSSA